MALCSPLVAAGGLADLAYQEEVCYGQLPAVPALKVFRRRSTSLTLTKDSYSSEEIRSDRMVSDMRHGIRRAGGDVVAELSPGSHADAWEALLGGIWKTPANIALTTNSVATLTQGTDLMKFTITATTWGAANVRPGVTLSFTGANAAYDGKLFTVVSAPAPTEVIVQTPVGFPTAPQTLNTGTANIRGAICSMGTVDRSFTFERAFADIGSFILFKGMKFNTAAVDLPATGIATATFGLLGSDVTPISGASFDGSAAVVVTDSTHGILTFAEGAGTITAATGSWVTDGFAVGDRVLFDGVGFNAMGQNRNPRTVTAVTATVLTVAEAIQSGVTAGAYTVTKVGLPAYTAAPTNPVLVAVSGILLINGVPAATVTGASFNVDNAMAGSEVVGSNKIPKILYGNMCSITGSMTVLFDRGGMGETIYNAFDLETDLSLVMRLDDPATGAFLSFVFPRVKASSGSIGDAAAEGLPVSVDWQALKPLSASGLVSQMSVQDSSVTGMAVASGTAILMMAPGPTAGSVRSLEVEGDEGDEGDEDDGDEDEGEARAPRRARKPQADAA